MSKQDDEKRFVLELFGLEKADVRDIAYSNLNGSANVDITLNNTPSSCPDCGYGVPEIKSYVIKKITHSVLTDRKCILRYHARRYKCPVCGRTYYEKNPFTFGRDKISTLTVQNILTDLKDFNETFSSVARRYHVSPTTVSSIFDQHVNISRKTLPKYLNFDEVYAFHSSDSKYVFVILDFLTRKPIDILPSRKEKDLMSYFMSIPLEERKEVKACCFDMYKTYREITKRCFPNSITVCDHFHVCQELSRQIDSLRIEIMKEYCKGTDEYYLLKKFNWMLYKNVDDKAKDGKTLFDPNRKKKYDHHFQQYLNYYDIRERLSNVDKRFHTAINLRDDVVDFYNTATIETAEQRLRELIIEFRECDIEQLISFSKTLSNWKVEIINSFYVLDNHYKINPETGEAEQINVKMSNGIIENRNSIIKCIKHNANGYYNWLRFRNRVLYVLDKDARYMLNPIPQRKVKK